MKSAKKHRKGFISEEDMSNLLHRYPAQKVLALLQEVFQLADAKMNWNDLVKKTATGITNAREYQMLWRHIAYSEDLLEKIDDGAEPMDDDSDLEYELEAYPAVTAEASAEAAACVKVLIGPGLTGESKVPSSSTVEAPLTINIPNGQSSKSSIKDSLTASMQGKNITVPVSLQKQPIPQGSVQKQSVPVGATSEGSDANGSTSTTLPLRRKRKPWSEEEDLELIAAVRKCGEGNWANILKGDFKGDRTASQLSQRWAIIRKKQSNLNIGAQSAAAGPQLSDAQLATRRAIDMALKDSLLTGNGATTTSNPAVLNSLNEDNAVVKHTLSQPQQSQSNPVGGNPVTSKPGTSSSVPNPQAPPPQGPVKPVLNPDSSMVTKIAVAAGARIASPSDAASLFKVAQANNAVHIMPKGGSTLIKSSVTSSSNPTVATHVGPNRTMPLGNQPGRANFIRPTISSPTSSVAISHATGSQPVRNNSVRPTVLPAQPSKASTSSILPNNSAAPLSQALQVVTATGSSAETDATACHPANEVEVKKEEKTNEEMKVPPPPRLLAGPVPKTVEAQQNPTPVSSSVELVASDQAAATENSQCSVSTEKEKSGIGSSRGGAVDKAAEENSVDDLKNMNESLAEGKHGEALDGKQEDIASGKQENSPSSKVAGDAKSEVKSMTIAGAEKSEQREQ